MISMTKHQSTYWFNSVWVIKVTFDVESEGVLVHNVPSGNVLSLIQQSMSRSIVRHTKRVSQSCENGCSAVVDLTNNVTFSAVRVVSKGEIVDSRVVLRSARSCCPKKKWQILPLLPPCWILIQHIVCVPLWTDLFCGHENQEKSQKQHGVGPRCIFDVGFRRYMFILVFQTLRDKSLKHSKPMVLTLAASVKAWSSLQMKK